jgi:universal stress protein A
MTQPRHVLVPVDFSRCSRAALAYAVARSDRTPTIIDILYVGRPVKTNVALHVSEGHLSLKEFATASAMRDLEKLAASMHTHGPVQIHPSVAFGEPVEVILGIARERGHDQIIMGAHSQSARVDVRLGAVADRVAREAPCPVVTVSGDQARSEWAARVAKVLEIPRPSLVPASDVPLKWID